MLPTFIIGLREGLEAALIVGIIAAFLGQQGRKDALRQVWIGTIAAVLICIGIGITLELISRELPQRQQEGLETVVGFIAVGMVTYMVLWMRKHARGMKHELEDHAASALATGSARALVAMAFLAVMREGFETAVFLLATFQHSTNPLAGGIGALLGILVAVFIGWLIFRGGLKLNLGRFFFVTGLVLVFIAAGLVMSSLRTANEAGWLTFGQGQPIDLTWLVRPGTPVSSLVTGVLGIQQKPATIEIIGYLAYLIPMVTLLVVSNRSSRRPAPKAVTATTRASMDDTTPCPPLHPNLPPHTRHSSILWSPDHSFIIQQPPSQGAPVPSNPTETATSRLTRRLQPSGPARRLAAIGLAASMVGVLASGCASSTSSASGSKGKGVAISLTDDGCEPSPAKATAGPTTFTVTNKSANGVSEAELRTKDAKHILGERENLTPGLDGTFSLTLAEGTYKVYCPGAKQDTWTFTVRGGEAVKDWHSNPALVKAVNGYASYVNDQVAELVSATTTFVDAVNSGNVDAAKKAYVAARLPYERIEPVAESFGDLDPRIDGRLGDNGDKPSDFIGFHRIEQSLWADNSLEGMKPIAAGLLADVHKLQALVKKKAGSYDPNEVTSGAVDLMNEVLTSKISGEEERYSHIDMVDFQANFDGSMETITLLRPVLSKSAPDLLAKIDAQAKKVQTALNGLKANPGVDDSGYVAWSCAKDDQGELPEGCIEATSGPVTTAQRKQLNDAGKPLADLMAQVPVKVVR